jgi:ATP-grasp domain, R2K clade family 3
VFVHCADPLDPRRRDPHFAGEARGVRALIDHDLLLAGDAAGAVARVPRGGGPAWYRGWMVPPDAYARLECALAARGVTLLTSPEHYRRAHELPGWYEVFAELTPRSVWLPAAPGKPPGAAELAALTEPLGGGPVVVKDYVKSRKHEWHEAAYVPESADTGRLAAVVARFFELQGEFLAGGVVVRAFEEFDGAGEARVWWVDGEPVLVTAHPDTPGSRVEPALDAVRAPVRALGCRFVTTDLVRRADGCWRVVEVGDGQVSDLPSGTDPGPLLDALEATAAG